MTERAPADRPALLGALALLVVFLAGVGVGVLVSGDDPAPTTRRAAPPALFEDLELTAEQRAHVDSVLTATERATDAVLDDARVELTTRATDALRAIETVLTSDQIETVRGRIRDAEVPGTRSMEMGTTR